MNSEKLTIICICLIALVLTISIIVVTTQKNVVETSENAVASEISSSESVEQSSSNPLAGMEGTDLYRATHSDLITIGVIQSNDGNYIYYGGSADGETWGYTNFDSNGNRISSASVGSDREAMENAYHNYASSGKGKVII